MVSPTTDTRTALAVLPGRAPALRLDLRVRHTGAGTFSQLPLEATMNGRPARRVGIVQVRPSDSRVDVAEFPAANDFDRASLRQFVGQILSGEIDYTTWRTEGGVSHAIAIRYMDPVNCDRFGCAGSRQDHDRLAFPDFVLHGTEEIEHVSKGYSLRLEAEDDGPWKVCSDITEDLSLRTAADLATDLQNLVMQAAGLTAAEKASVA